MAFEKVAFLYISYDRGIFITPLHGLLKSINTHSFSGSTVFFIRLQRAQSENNVIQTLDRTYTIRSKQLEVN